MEYPTSSVRVQYTTVSVGITSPGLGLAGTSPKKIPPGNKNQQIGVSIVEKPGTIWRKRTSFHQHHEQWQPSADTPRYASSPGTKTPNMSSAWIVARSLTPKNSVTWRLKRPPKQNPAWKTPDASAPAPGSPR